MQHHFIEWLGLCSLSAVNMTQMPEPVEDHIFRRAEEMFLNNIIYGEVISYEATGRDTIKDAIAHTLTAKCPHCGEVTQYKDYFPERPVKLLWDIGIRIACRSCNQRYNLPFRQLERKCSDPESARQIRERHAAFHHRRTLLFLQLGKPRRALTAWCEYILVSRRFREFPSFVPEYLKSRNRWNLVKSLLAELDPDGRITWARL